MGNSLTISFNRAISDDQFTKMLETVAEKHFPLHGVEYHSNECESPSEPCWVFRLKADVLSVEDGYEQQDLEDGREDWSLYIWRSTNYAKGESYPYPLHKGKFEHNMKGGEWKWWFADQLHGYMTTYFKSKSGSDGCAGSWKVDPKECPTFRSWLNKHYQKSWARNQQFADVYVDELPLKLQGMVL